MRSIDDPAIFVRDYKALSGNTAHQHLMSVIANRRDEAARAAFGGSAEERAIYGVLANLVGHVPLMGAPEGYLDRIAPEQLKKLAEVGAPRQPKAPESKAGTS